MSADLLGTLRLVHRVTGFLVTLSPAELTDIAAGRLSLKLDKPRLPDPGERTDVDVPPPSPPPTADEVLVRAAAELRTLDSTDAGIAYLKGLKVNGKALAKNDVLTLAGLLGLTLARSVTKGDATDKVLRHAIGNRRSYAGLTP